MADALIGYSGFVGSTLQKQGSYHFLFNSKNIEEIDNKNFDTIICAGASAQKWIANRDPEEDRLKIEALITHLRTVTCKNFILISTVDVFKNAVGVDEETTVISDGLQPYGQHRRYLEEFVQSNFPEHLIVRLPGLVGPGLRKNVVYDFLNNNNLDMIDSRSVFQFYPTVNLANDLETAMSHRLHILHLTAEPLSVADLAQKGFGHTFTHHLDAVPVSYDFRTIHAELFGSPGPYQYSAQDSLQAIRVYAQSEPVTKK